ncbi:hypothetical protein AC578_7030 [Pseudocercospora eumusae]|uniref:BTB domain-containing protein n=1 Tax=Pseudocercospora eumusae TaxID=321146 RepID=A0A139HCL2_9PEZI|nr:hypothetical protein AC578_7030 [Pseudocercospora eumusae]
MNPDTAVTSIEQPDPIHKAVGSTWLAPYNRQRWPVVLCDEKEPPRAFIATRPKDSSLRPAILLGKHKYIWVNEVYLDQYIPRSDYLDGITPFSPEDIQPNDDERTKNEKLRHIAFRREAPMMEQNVFWNNFVLQQWAARKVKKQMATGRKRKRASITPNSSLPLRHDSAREDSSKSVEVIEIDDRTDSGGEVSSHESVYGTHSCHIIVGQTKKSYVLHQKYLRGCDYLLALREKNGHSGGYLIDLSNEQRAIERRLSPKDFELVVHFMSARDIGPKYVNAPDDPPRISKEDSMPKQKTKWAEKLVYAFIAASKVQFEEMQEVIHDKLKTLSPLESPGICIIARAVAYMGPPENDTERELARFVIEHITEYFWKIAREQGSSLQRILEESDELRSAVYENLIQNSMAGKQGFD